MVEAWKFQKHDVEIKNGTHFPAKSYPKIECQIYIIPEFLVLSG